MISDVRICFQKITNVGYWIFSRSSLGVLLIFSGCSQDFPRIFSGCSDGSCERGGSGRSFGSSSSGGSCGSCGSSGFGGSCESDLIQKYCQMELLSFMIDKKFMILKPLVVISNESMDFNDPKEFNDILVYPDPKGISIGSMDFDNPKVDVDNFILDGLDYVARPGSASLKIVKIKRRGTRKLLKSLYYTTLCDYLLQVMRSA